MPNKLICILIIIFFFTSCSMDSHSSLNEGILVKEDKSVDFEFFTLKDYQDAKYDGYLVKLNLALSTHEKLSGKELKVEKFQSDWIRFKDIPSEQRKIIYTQTIKNVSVDQEVVNISYAIQVKINETLQLNARNEWMRQEEIKKTIKLIL